MNTIFANLPTQAQPEEVIEAILETNQFNLKRIISTGQSTPSDQWYDQEDDEWCILLKGKAALRFENEKNLLELNPGDYVHIPAHKRHQVAWTADNEATVWLALHYAAK